MSAFLLTWNPNWWNWDDLDKYIEDLSSNGTATINWNCSNSKRIQQGDRLFLIRLGREPKGIVASGWANSSWFEDLHWDSAKAAEGKTTNYVEVIFDVLLHPEREKILSRDRLNRGVLSNMHWDSQSSGVSIPENVVTELEVEWSLFSNGRSENSPIYLPSLAEEIMKQNKFFEGSVKQIFVNVYERNAKARKECLDHFGYNCSVCGFNFEQVYGDIGKSFIHVHHILPLSQIGREYELHPINDLRPVCPNCHAMIHKNRDELTIEGLRRKLNLG